MSTLTDRLRARWFEEHKSKLPDGYTKITGCRFPGSAYIRTSISIPALLGADIEAMPAQDATVYGSAYILGGGEAGYTNAGRKSCYLYRNKSNLSQVKADITEYNVNNTRKDITTGYKTETGHSFCEYRFTDTKISVRWNRGSWVELEDDFTYAFPNYPIYIGAHSPGTMFHGDIYAVTIYATMGAYQFIPARRDSDNAIGFYSVKEDVFYTHAKLTEATI